jgi:hypothetical protein
MAFLKGYEACEQYVRYSVYTENPHPKGSAKYEHWKRGWQACFNGEE